jgi:predicted nucleotidyltransferase
MEMATAPVILEGIVGSTAYGLATATSDVDKLGVKLLPNRHFLGLETPSEGSLSQVTTDPDTTYHDIGKYCRLALTCNPTAMELMWLPNYTKTTDVGEWLIDNRMSFISAEKVRNSFMGYASSQFKRLSERQHSFSSDTKNRTQKHARHLLRLMHQGYTLYTTGVLPIQLEDPQRYHEFGALVEANPNHARQTLEEYTRMFDLATPVIPLEADRELVDHFVFGVRSGMWEFI